MVKRSTQGQKEPHAMVPYTWRGECPHCRLKRLGARGIRLWGDVCKGR